MYDFALDGLNGSDFLFLHLFFNDFLLSDFWDVVVVFGLFFLAFGNQGIVFAGEGEISFLFEFFLIIDDFELGSVLEDFQTVFTLFLFAGVFKSLFFLFHCFYLGLKVFVLFKAGILKIGEPDVVWNELFLLSVHVKSHVLVLFRGLNDVLGERFFGAVDDSPECVVVRLGLFLFEKLDFHVHEMNLLQKVLNVFIFNVEIGIEAKAFAFAQNVACSILIFFRMVIDLIRKKIRLLARLTELDVCILPRDWLLR